ncbi:MAG: TipAS antibiotic-recognition domain-containing protein, partial [Chloroflexota bacterium]
VEDSRFTEFYDKYRPGLAKFMRAAMHAYADRLAKGQ